MGYFTQSSREKEMHRQIGLLKAHMAEKDKKIQRLENNARAAADLAAAKAEDRYRKALKRLQNENARLADQNDRLKEQNLKLRETIKENKDMISDISLTSARLQKFIEAQKFIIADQYDEIIHLKKSKARNHTNSSVPSSQDPVGTVGKVCNSRTKSERKPGKQPGTKGAPRPSPAPGEAVTTACVDEVSEDSGEWKKTGKYRESFSLDLKVIPVWTRYVSYEYENTRTGEKKYADFPPHVVNEMCYSPHYKALILYLHEFCNVPVKKTVEFFRALAGDRLAPSAGLVCNLPAQMSELTEGYREQKIERMLSLDGLHVDHTPVKVSGERREVLVLRHRSEGTIYTVSKTKSIADLEKTFLCDYSHTLVHDHASAFYHFGTAHQECLAHVMRYLTAASEENTKLTWAKKMHDLMAEMISAVNASGKGRVSDDEAEDFRKRYEKILNTADREYVKYPPTKYNHEGFNLARRLRKYEDEHLAFLTMPDVAATNNEAESCARKVKRVMKRKGTWREDKHIGYDCDTLAILEDARLREINPVEAMTKLFMKEEHVPKELDGYVDECKLKEASSQ